MPTYRVTNGRAKVQIEDLLGTNPSGGWVYQRPGQGNANAEGAHYYYRSQTLQGSHKTAPQNGRFSFDLDVQEAGTYSILLRAARDTNNPGDARNDIWIRVDGDTQDVMPRGTPELTSGGGGFVKFKGAQTSWINARQFSTDVHGDKNPASDVVFDKGIHTISFAPRSTGFHIDSVQIVRVGSSPNPPDPDPDDPEPEPEPGVTAARIAATHDDFEANKAGASDDLEFGRDGDGAQSVGLRFKGLDVDAGADITSAYFVFQAAKTSSGAAQFEIEIEDTTNAATYSRTDAPDDRSYIGPDVDWTVTAWTAGRSYRSPDISALIEAVIDDGGLDALDALGFRIRGSGARAAEAFESDGAAPELIINYA